MFKRAYQAATLMACMIPLQVSAQEDHSLQSLLSSCYQVPESEAYAGRRDARQLYESVLDHQKEFEVEPGVLYAGVSLPGKIGSPELYEVRAFRAEKTHFPRVMILSEGKQGSSFPHASYVDCHVDGNIDDVVGNDTSRSQERYHELLGPLERQVNHSMGRMHYLPYRAEDSYYLPQ